MSQVKVSGNASGTGVFEVTAPNTNTNYTLTLPQATTTLVGTDATQTLTNKTINGGAITSGTAVASTSGTSIDFTSIPSWVKRITVMFNGISTSGTSNTIVQVGAGSVTTSGYLGSGSIIQNAAGTITSAFTTGFGVNASIVAATITQGTMIINSFGNNIWVASGNISNTNAAITGASSGVVTLGGTLDRLRLTTVGGTDTFDAGSINILYE